MGPGSDGPMGALEPHHINGSLGKTQFSIATSINNFNQFGFYYPNSTNWIPCDLQWSNLSLILANFLTGSGDIDGLPKVLLKQLFSVEILLKLAKQDCMSEHADLYRWD